MIDKVKINILIFPGGTENALEIFRSLRFLKEVKIFSATSDVINHAPYVYNFNHVIREVGKSGWIDDLNRVIEENFIDLIFPANSFVIDYLNRHRSEIKTKILLPNESVINITRSKKLTTAALNNVIPVAISYNSIETIDEFPVFIKPDNGYGSQNTHLIRDRESFEKIQNIKDFIIQEYLGGDEYTIDCFSDRHNCLRFVGGRKRERIRMGTSMHCEVVDENLNKYFSEIAQKIQDKIRPRGAWFFQLKEDKNKNLKLLEIDVRIAGTMACNRVRGINFSMLAIFDFMERDVDILLNDYRLTIDRCLLNRYSHNINYHTVYVDLDDTIIAHNKINIEIISFLYQCINSGKKIILISKSLEKDREEYLKKMRIYQIFTEIYWLQETDSKAELIRKLGAQESILIDDSFSQRQEVVQKLGIPTFDNSMIEVLLDDRV